VSTTAATAILAAAGVAVGWFVLVRIIERLPDPDPLPAPARVAVAVINGALWGLFAWRFLDGPEHVTVGAVAADGTTINLVSAEVLPHGAGFALPVLLLVSVLLTVSVIDLRVYRIPDKVTFPALAISVPAVAIGAVVALGRTEGLDHARNAVIGMLLYFVALFLPHLIYPRGMGFGDVKLGLIMGLYLGWLGISLFDVVYLVLIAIMLGCILGVIMGLVTNVVRRKGGAFPFGPALAAGALYVVLTFDRYLTGL
jgi:prepilin signal peptidase PulO-like enzyme (type II secretory pathway)